MRSKFKQLQKREGFSLVEMMLYIAITSTVILGISTFLLVLLQAKVKNQTISEVDQQGLQVVHMITQTIRNADSITSPAIGVTDSTLTLVVNDAAKSPTVYDLSSGTMRITEGLGAPVALTNSRIVVSDLSFRNVGRAGTEGLIRVEFTITHVNLEGRNEYTYSKFFYDSASVR
ncbi:MAG TPA: hypothetical protein ENI23_00770 [bacterium]|nr:hypothetical protein [bacterium]